MPDYTTLIDCDQLATLLQQGPAPAIFDCRFDLAAPDAGEAGYAEAHLPTAQYLHLDRDLSGSQSGLNGRHPLPSRDALIQRLRDAGLNQGQQVVVYDAQGGMFAARAWWLLRWLGHRAVAVLDGGVAAWQASDGALHTDTLTPVRGDFIDTKALVGTIDRQALLTNVQQRGPLTVIDARSADRFRGENETLDLRAGHIPGARNRFFRDNLASDGRFKPADRLRQEFEALTGQADARDWVQQCGSGVTACHNLLALELAGLPGSRLYPGSWSEWSSHPEAPLAQGDAV